MIGVQAGSLARVTGIEGLSAGPSSPYRSQAEVRPTVDAIDYAAPTLASEHHRLAGTHFDGGASSSTRCRHCSPRVVSYDSSRGFVGVNAAKRPFSSAETRLEDPLVVMETSR